MPDDAFPGAVTRISLTVQSHPAAVRAALGEVCAALRARALDRDSCENAELVLAEVLNNIVKHAYRGRGGVIGIALRIGGGQVAFRITDCGRPMPDGRLPAGLLPDNRPGLPVSEGGYGWFLIRSLSRGLNYRRDGDRNILSFRVASDARPLRPP